MEILFGPEIAVRLVRHIEESRRAIFLVTPYFDPWPHLTMAVRNAIRVHRVKVIMILRGGADRAKQEEKAQEFVDMGVTVKFVERLHAKLYMCDDVAVITSLNLLQSSMSGSYELATIFNKKDDPDGYQQLRDVIQQISNLVRASEADVLEEQIKQIQRVRASVPRVKDTGHCLRCGTAIPINPDAPYCRACYKNWSRWQNPDYKEPYCHSCGIETETTMNRPLCRSCYRAGS